MTAAGWAMLVISWSAIGSLAAYCLYRTLRAGALETGEEDDADRPSRVDRHGDP